MIKVGLLTLSQKDQLFDSYLKFNWKFNPIQDINDNWVISTQEMQQCTNVEFLWVKNLPLIDFEPKVDDELNEI